MINILLFNKKKDQYEWFKTQKLSNHPKNVFIKSFKEYLTNIKYFIYYQEEQCIFSRYHTIWRNLELISFYNWRVIDIILYNYNILFKLNDKYIHSQLSSIEQITLNIISLVFNPMLNTIIFNLDLFKNFKNDQLIKLFNIFKHYEKTNTHIYLVDTDMTYVYYIEKIQKQAKVYYIFYNHHRSMMIDKFIKYDHPLIINKKKLYFKFIKNL